MLFNKLSYLKSISLIMLAGKVFKDYEMFTWFEVLGVVLIPAIIFVVLDALFNKAKSWEESYLSHVQSETKI